MTLSRNPFCDSLLLALLFLSLTVILKKWHFGLQEIKPFGDAARPDGLTPARDRLLQQLKERQQELELLDITFDNKQDFMDPSFSTNDSANYINGKFSLDNSVTAKTDIGCEELSGIKAVDFLGSGYTKTVLKAALPQGLFVALKSVNHQGTDMRLCMEDFQDSQGCHELVSFKLRKEIVLLQRLQHPNIVEVRKTPLCLSPLSLSRLCRCNVIYNIRYAKTYYHTLPFAPVYPLNLLCSFQLKGQCQDSALVGGITAVLEQGMPLQMIQLLQSPWEERFRVRAPPPGLLWSVNQRFPTHSSPTGHTWGGGGWNSLGWVD